MIILQTTINFYDYLIIGSNHRQTNYFLLNNGIEEQASPYITLLVTG